MVNIDLNALDAELGKIGWTRVQMEESLGRPVVSVMSQEDRRIMWGHIVAAKRVLIRLRAWFPKATVEKITLLDGDNG